MNSLMIFFLQYNVINLQTNKDIKDLRINHFPFTSWHDQGLPECIG